jgi:hypothetical protein
MPSEQNTDMGDNVLLFREPLPHEVLDDCSKLLIANLRNSWAIQSELLARILSHTPRPSRYLAEFLEDAGNRYLDFAEVMSAASQIE